MTHPYSILLNHEQKHDKSCVAMGLELILKMHGKIQQDEYPFQNGIEPNTNLGPCDWGFGEKERNFLLTEYNLVSNSGNLDLADFEALMISEITKGSFPIFTFPSQIVKCSTSGDIYVDLHTWVATLSHRGLLYLSRTYKHPKILSGLEMAKELPRVRRELGYKYLLNYLIHG